MRLAEVDASTKMVVSEDEALPSCMRSSRLSQQSSIEIIFESGRSLLPFVRGKSYDDRTSHARSIHLMFAWTTQSLIEPFNAFLFVYVTHRSLPSSAHAARQSDRLD